MDDKATAVTWNLKSVTPPPSATKKTFSRWIWKISVLRHRGFFRFSTSRINENLITASPNNQSGYKAYLVLQRSGSTKLRNQTDPKLYSRHATTKKFPDLRPRRKSVRSPTSPFHGRQSSIQSLESNARQNHSCVRNLTSLPKGQSATWLWNPKFFKILVSWKITFLATS